MFDLHSTCGPNGKPRNDFMGPCNKGRYYEAGGQIGGDGGRTSRPGRDRRGKVTPKAGLWGRD